MSVDEIGCCGAYCKTCAVFRAESCKGCKLGYSDGKRNLDKAKCAIKVCCIRRGFATCADCPAYAQCPTIGDFFAHQGTKYQKYRQALNFIAANGYDAFLQIADCWGNAYGRYDGVDRRGNS